MTEEHHASFATLQPVIEVTDVAEAIRYYNDVLGFELGFAVDDPPTYAVVGRDGFSRGAHASIRLTGFYQGRDAPRAAGWLHVHMDAGIDALHDELVGRGAEVVWELGDREWGQREFEVSDPDGNLLRFSQPLGC